MFLRTILLLSVLILPSLSAGPKILELKGTYPAPPRADDGRIAKAAVSGKPRNIIFIIGDGMGQAVLELASRHAHGEAEKLVLNQYPITGLATTHSANSKVTDSAASGTALSSGYKTNNGMLGMSPDGTWHKSIATLAQESGRSVGIITTDCLTGATPAAFLSHVNKRGKSEEIALQEAKSKMEILIGNSEKPFLPAAKKGIRNDGRDLIAELKTAGYTQIQSAEALKKANPEKPVFGFIPNWDSTAKLSQISSAAMNFLNRNPKGFFLMIEGDYPDKGGHNNKPEKSVNGVLMVDFTAKAALDFALTHPDTLVVITADHETGGISVAPNPGKSKTPYFLYTTTSHTGTPVRIFAFGPGAERFAGLLDNTEIPKTFADFWNLPLTPPAAK